MAKKAQEDSKVIISSTPKARRENGAGTEPKQEANGRWYLKISYRDPGTDELKRKTIRGESQGDVLSKKKEFLKAIDAGIKPITKKLTLQDWLATWLEVNKKGSVTLGSYDVYERIVNCHIKDTDLGRMVLNKISRADLQKYFNEKAKQVSAKYLTNIRVVLADALKVAELDKLIIVSPCKNIKLPKVEKKEINPLTQEEANKLLATAGSGSLMHAIIFTALRTGMREGEIIGLRWNDIDFKNNQINVRQQAKYEPKQEVKVVLGPLKTGSSYRLIPLEKKLAEVLKAHKAQQAKEKLALGEAYQKTNLVFAVADGGIINPKNLSHWFEKIMAKTSIPRRTFHQLRHTFASVAISKGLSIKTVSTILGHKKVDITLDTYGHLLPGDMDTVINAVAAYYDS